MSKDIRVRLYSNSTEFKNDMKAVANQMKLVKSEFEANRTAVDQWGNQFKQSETQMQFLTKQIDLQKQKVDTLTKAYADSADKKGQDAQETQNLARKLNYATAELNKMQNELTQTNQKLNQFKENESINKFSNDMNSLSLAMKKIDSDFKLASSAAENFGNEIKQASLHGVALTDKLEIQRQAVNRLEQEYHRVAQAKGLDANETKQLAIRLNEAQAGLNGIQNELSQTEQRLQQLSNELKQQSSAWGKFTNNMDTVGNKMQQIGGSMAATGAVGFTTLTYAMKSAVDVGMEFGAQVSRVGAIAGATSEEVEALKDQALDLGASTSKSASEIAKGQESLAALGMTVDEVIGAMPGVISAAEASGSDMAQTAEVMASTLNIFGLEAREATRVADILAKTAMISAADLTDMQYALKYAGPPAKALGISLEELAASIGIMTDAGMEGEQAGTTLRAALLRLVDPPKEAADQLKNLGVSATDSNDKFVGLESIVGQLSKGMQGMTEAQKTAALATIFGTEAVSGMISLISAGPTEIDKMTTSLENSAGASATAAAQMKDNLKGSIDEMSGAIETAKIKFTEGLTPAIEGVAGVVTGLVQKWNELDQGTQEIIATSTALGTAMLGVTALVGTLTLGVGALLTFAGPVGLAITGGTAALGALSIAGYAGAKSMDNMAKAQDQAKEKALLYGDGVSQATVKASDSYVKMREKAELQMFQLSQTTGEKANEMATKIVGTYSKMSTEVITELETFKKDVSVVMEQLFQDTGKKFQDQKQQFEKEALGAIDKDIAKTKEALDTIKKYQQEFSLDTSKMTAAQQQELSKAFNVFQEMTSAFAKNQKDAMEIQKSIASENGKLSYKQAKEYNTQIKQVYDEGQKAVEKDYQYRKDIISKMDVNDKARQAFMAKNEADYQKDLAKNTETYRQNAEALFQTMSQNGKLLDLESGKQFERLKGWDATTRSYIIESEKDYQTRWAAQQVEYFQKLGESKESAMQKTQQELVKFFQGMGLTLEQAKQEASKVVKGVNDELNKGNKDAEKAGEDKVKSKAKGIEKSKGEVEKASKNVTNAADKELSEKKKDAEKHGEDKTNNHAKGIDSKKGEVEKASKDVSNTGDKGLSEKKQDAKKHGEDKGKNHSKGVESTKDSNKKAGDSVSKSSDEGLSKQKSDANKHGKDRGDNHKKGVESTVSANKGAGEKVAKGADSGLSNKGNSDKHGKAKGDNHGKGLQSTQGSNSTISKTLSDFVSRMLGKTTDGGGGKKAGSDLGKGISSQQGSVNKSAKNVADSAEKGLKTAKGKPIGEGIASGVSAGINSGSSGVLTSAINLAKGAIRAAKNALDINSPSGEAEREIGYWYSAGVAKGMLGNVGAVQQAAQSVARAAVPNARANLQLTEWQQREMTRIAKTCAKDRLKAVEDWLSKQKELGNINAANEVAIWNYVSRNFKLNTEDKKKAVISFNNVKKGYDKELFDNEKAWIEARKNENKLSLIQELKAWEEVSKRYKKGTEERIAAEQQVSSVKKQIYDELKVASDDYLKSVQELNQQLIAEEQRLNDEYQKAVDQRTQAIVNTYGIFDALKEKETVASDTLIANLEGQVKALTEWSTNVQLLAERGIDDGLLKELQAMGPNASAEIIALVNMTDEQLMQFESLWKEKSRLAREQAVKELEGMKKDTESKIAEMHSKTNQQLDVLKSDFNKRVSEIRVNTTKEFDAMKATLPSIGTNAISGLIQGMESMRGPLQAKAAELAKLVETTMKRALDVRSPSRKIKYNVAQWIPLGLVEGMDEKKNAVVSAAQRMAQAAIPNISNVAQTIGNAANTIKMHSGSLTIKNIVQTPNLEDKLDRLLGLFEKLLVQDSKPAQITQHLTFTSPQSTPSENARKQKQALRQVAMEWGLN